VLIIGIWLFAVAAIGWSAYKQNKIINYGSCPKMPYSLDAKASTTFIVYANQSFYRENMTPERLYRGVLDVRKEGHLKEYLYDLLGWGSIPIDTVFYRPFILRQENGSEITVKQQDTKDRILGAHLGQQVEICGKYVKLDSQAGGWTKLWPGYLLPLTPPSR
jgi:hypothetical protein